VKFSEAVVKMTSVIRVSNSSLFLPRLLSKLVRSTSSRTSPNLEFLSSSTPHENKLSSQFRNISSKALPTGIIDEGDEKYIVRSPYPDVEIPEANLADFVLEDADEFKDNVALMCGMTGRHFSYSQLKYTVIKFGSAMRRLGAERGDVVAFILPNIPEFPVAFLGCAGVGLTVTTINPTYRAEEIAKQLENSGTKYILTIGNLLAQTKQACAITDETSKIKEIIIIAEQDQDGCKSIMSLIKDEDGSMYRTSEDEAKFDPHSDVVAMPYSSGTTGAPKGVMLTHYNMVANACQVTGPGISPIKSAKETGSQDVTIAVLPFFHIYAMETIMVLGLRLGMKIVTLPRFDPAHFGKALITHKPTLLNLVPPLVSFLSSDPSIKSQYLASVKHVTGGAAPFGPTMISKFLKKCAPNVPVFQEGFGMTESSPVTHMQPIDDGFLGGCGHLVPNTIAKVVDLETGEPLGPEQEGELCVSGPQVMLGYHRNRRATKNTVKEGWLHTGDVAKYREDGQFIIIDRLKELIKVKGYQVAPSELEDLIRQHEGVTEVAVTGVPDERAGELPRAYVIRKNRKVQEQDIMKFVAAHVAPHKKLQGVMMVDSLPKNQTGKVLRRELKAQVFKGSFGY